jgi:hypothetical protein
MPDENPNPITPAEQNVQVPGEARSANPEQPPTQQPGPQEFSAGPDPGVASGQQSPQVDDLGIGQVFTAKLQEELVNQPPSAAARAGWMAVQRHLEGRRFQRVQDEAGNVKYEEVS